jgi:hypothetical protein
MNGAVMIQLTQPTEEKPTGPDTSHEPQRVRVAALLNTAAALGTAVLVVTMAGPKIPPGAGD